MRLTRVPGAAASAKSLLAVAGLLPPSILPGQEGRLTLNDELGGCFGGSCGCSVAGRCRSRFAFGCLSRVGNNSLVDLSSSWMAGNRAFRNSFGTTFCSRAMITWVLVAADIIALFSRLMKTVGLSLLSPVTQTTGAVQPNASPPTHPVNQLPRRESHFSDLVYRESLSLFKVLEPCWTFRLVSESEVVFSWSIWLDAAIESFFGDSFGILGIRPPQLSESSMRIGLSQTSSVGTCAALDAWLRVRHSSFQYNRGSSWSPKT